MRSVFANLRDLVLPFGAQRGTARIVIGPDLPTPLDSYDFTNAFGGSGGPYTARAALLFYFGTSGDSYDYLAVVRNVGPSVFGGLVYGSVNTGAMVENAPGVPSGLKFPFAQGGFDLFGTVFAGRYTGTSFSWNWVNGTIFGKLAFLNWNSDLAPITAGGANDIWVDGTSIGRGQVAYVDSVATPVATATSTTHVAILSVTATLRNGRAFRVTVHGLTDSSIAQPVFHAVFRNNVTGSRIVSLGFPRVLNANTALPEPLTHTGLVKNASGADITDTWIWSFGLQSGTTAVDLTTAGNSPAYLLIEDIGAASDYPNATQV